MKSQQVRHIHLYEVGRFSLILRKKDIGPTMDRHRTDTAENLLVNVPISRSMKTVRAHSRTPVRSEERRIRRPSPQGVAENGSKRQDMLHRGDPRGFATVYSFGHDVPYSSECGRLAPLQ